MAHQDHADRREIPAPLERREVKETWVSPEHQVRWVLPAHPARSANVESPDARERQAPTAPPAHQDPPVNRVSLERLAPRVLAEIWAPRVHLDPLVPPVPPDPRVARVLLVLHLAPRVLLESLVRRATEVHLDPRELLEPMVKWDRRDSMV